MQILIANFNQQEQEQEQEQEQGQEEEHRLRAHMRVQGRRLRAYMRAAQERGQEQRQETPIGHRTRRRITELFQNFVDINPAVVPHFTVQIRLLIPLRRLCLKVWKATSKQT